MYDSITALESYRDKKLSKNFIPETILQQLNTNLWQQWTDWLPQFQSIASLIIHPSENPLTALNLLQYSASVNDEISAQTQKLLKLLTDFNIKSQSLANSIYFPFPIQAKTEWEQYVQVIIVFQQLPDIHLELIGYLSDKENYSVYEEWSKVYNKYQILLNSILKDYNRNILTSDVSSIKIQWKKAQQSWFLLKWFQSRKIKKQLSVYRNVPFNSDSEIEELFLLQDQLQEVQRLLQQDVFYQYNKP